MSSSKESNTKVGILSMGDMGVGIAKLLMARGFAVVTNCQGRSPDTVHRAQAANVMIVPSDRHLVKQCQVILSIVPPRDAQATAQRILDALAEPASKPIFFVDLNAMSPSSAKTMALMFDKAPVRFLDGCILGLPPSLKDAEWRCPSILVSGPHRLSLSDRLAEALNVRSISGGVGAASGLKMCFAAMSKGFTAVATQSFCTAYRLGLVDELRREMGGFSPHLLALAEGGVPLMPPKAYRWVREMEEIAETMAEEGGWTRELFSGVAGTYRCVAEDDVLGKEKIGKRRRGTTIEDVAAVMAEGLERKKKKTE